MKFIDGHTLRKKEEETPKKALKWNLEGRRKPGRPKGSWIRTAQSETKKSLKQMKYTGVPKKRRVHNSLIFRLRKDLINLLHLLQITINTYAGSPPSSPIVRMN
jgi:hypothetical protein